MPVEQEFRFFLGIIWGAILKLFEPVEGRNALDGFLYFELNSSLQKPSARVTLFV